jgi:hypothetical protein
MGTQGEITWTHAEWNESALEALAPALRYDTEAGLRTLAEICHGAVLFEGSSQGEVIARYALRVDAYSAGTEAFIVAAAGTAIPGIDLTKRGIADAEARLIDCSTLALHTRRLGLVRKLTRLGFALDGFILRKKLKRDH